MEKHSVSRLSYLFAHLHLLSSYSFSSTLLSSNLSLLSASALLCFSSVHIVGSLTSKLPSNTMAHILLVSLFLSHIHMYTQIYICRYKQDIDTNTNIYIYKIRIYVYICWFLHLLLYLFICLRATPMLCPNMQRYRMICKRFP